MANFAKAFAVTMKAEGGYVNDPDDPGGETYKGIARARNPKWPGWVNIDLLRQQRNFPKSLEDDQKLQEHVQALYEASYWDKIRGDEIDDQDIAESIFDFAVNAGPRTSSKLAQLAAEATADGVIGPQTLEKLNNIDKKTFLALFALAKIGRYVKICETRLESRKYFFGWVRRTMETI